MRILLVCGKGGHAEQMSRLIDHIDNNLNIEYLSIVEKGTKLRNKDIIFDKTVHVMPLRPKDIQNIFITTGQSFFSMFQCFTATIYLIVKYKYKLMISTGPGIAIPVAIICKLFRCRIIHIETWSRFYSKSFAGKYMYKLATDFWVQNKELLLLYPKAKFVGRL